MMYLQRRDDLVLEAELMVALMLLSDAQFVQLIVELYKNRFLL